MPAERTNCTRAIVVGGGLAGITAARDLARSGISTVLCEANDRLGGRTETQKIANHEVDTGGAYFHWFEASLWADVMRYELPVVETDLSAIDTYLIGDCQGLTAVAAEELDERLRRALSSFWSDPVYADVLARPFAVQSDPRARQLDALSVEDRFRELELDPGDERVLRALFGDFGPPASTSLAWVLQRMANGVWSYEGFTALMAVYRLAGGMSGLIDAMVRDGGFEIRLSSPVTSIEHQDAGVTVALADGSKLAADVVVVATPVSMWKSISFTPALGEEHQAATDEGVVVASVTSMVLHVRGVPDPVAIFASYGDQPFEIMVTHTMLDDGQLIHSFSLDGSVTCQHGHDRIANELHSMLPGAELVNFVGHDWASDPFARGAWGALQTGQLTRFADILDKPIGRLLFATGDIAPQFSGLLTGAIESGARAAHRARSILESE